MVHYSYGLLVNSGFWDRKFVIWQLDEDETVESYKSQIINVLQDIMEIISQDIMISGHE